MLGFALGWLCVLWIAGNMADVGGVAGNMVMPDPNDEGWDRENWT